MFNPADIADGTYLWNRAAEQLLPIEPNSGYWVAIASITPYELTELSYAVVGVWRKAGALFFEVSVWIGDRREAERIGRANGQEAIWDIANSALIEL